MKLELENVKVGQRITVLSWKPRQQVVRGDILYGMGGQSVVMVTDRSYLGDALEVVAVSGPFIVAKALHCDYGNPDERPPVRLDTRECDIAELTEEYVAALLRAVSKELAARDSARLN